MSSNQDTSRRDNGATTATEPVTQAASERGATTQTSEAVSPPALGLAAVSSAAAAVVTSALWSKGAVASAATTPVVVSLVKEGLRRPAARITQARAALSPATEPVQSVRGALAAVARRRAQPEAAEGAERPGVAELAAAGSSRRRLLFAGRRLRLKPAIITGLLGFAIAAVCLTVPELLTGKSVSSALGAKPAATTLFGGGSHASGAPGASGGQGVPAGPPGVSPTTSPAPGRTPAGPGSQAQTTPRVPQSPVVPHSPSAHQSTQSQSTPSTSAVPQSGASTAQRPAP